MKQRIVIELELKEGQQPYELNESKRTGPNPNVEDYISLYRFFEDIEFTVNRITNEVNPEGPQEERYDLPGFTKKG